ncbi:MAG: hypothetical protein VX737_00445 [Pseudomonadota bacterium]|nr:hypothetical protein [Pseudomonadota bacterium]
MTIFYLTSLIAFSVGSAFAAADSGNGDVDPNTAADFVSGANDKPVATTDGTDGKPVATDDADGKPVATTDDADDKPVATDDADGKPVATVDSSDDK